MTSANESGREVSHVEAIGSIFGILVAITMMVSILVGTAVLGYWRLTDGYLDGVIFLLAPVLFASAILIYAIGRLRATGKEESE